MNAAVALSLAARQQGFHRVRRDDAFLALIGLEIGFDIARFVTIIDHHSKGLPHALGGAVGEEIDPLDARAVAQMKMRDTVDALIGPIERAQQITRRQPGKRLTQDLHGLVVALPA